MDHPGQKKDECIHKKFREYIPSISDSFSKPSNSGRKPGQQKRNRKQQEPDIVIDRDEATTSESLAAVGQAAGPSQRRAQFLLVLKAKLLLKEKFVSKIRE